MPDLQHETDSRGLLRTARRGFVPRSRARARSARLKGSVAGFGAVLLTVTLLPLGVLTPAAQAAPAGQGFTITPADLSFILEQIRIAEHHVATTDPATPCRDDDRNRPQPVPEPADLPRAADRRRVLQQPAPARRGSAPPTSCSRG